MCGGSGKSRTGDAGEPKQRKNERKKVNHLIASKTHYLCSLWSSRLCWTNTKRTPGRWMMIGLYANLISRSINQFRNQSITIDCIEVCGLCGLRGGVRPRSTRRRAAKSCVAFFFSSSAESSETRASFSLFSVLSKVSHFLLFFSASSSLLDLFFFFPSLSPNYICQDNTTENSY